MTRRTRKACIKGQFVTRMTDQGHYGRKAVYWGLIVLIFPVILINLAADLAGRFGEWLDLAAGTLVARVRIWANPCLYRQYNETYEDFMKRVPPVPAPVSSVPVRVNVRQKPERDDCS